VRIRHALLAGFGLGALAVTGLVAFNTDIGLRLQGRMTANSGLPSPSPSPTPLATSSASPGATPLDRVGSPGPLAGATLVYDPENKGLLLFGGARTQTTADGHTESVFPPGTWVWDGTSWRERKVEGPPARSSAVTTYDSVRHVVILFGGAGVDAGGRPILLDDTWTWDGAQWSQMTPVHVPPARYRAAIAFDQRRGVTVLYGGEGPTNTPYADTWTWNGEDWAEQSPATSPSPRHYPAMAYDAERGNMVMFGGSAAGIRLNDTWIWNGATWTKQTAPAPTAKGFGYATWDSKSKEVVVYVYYAVDNHPVTEYTITWNGARWTNRSTSGDPSPRADGSIAFDERTGQVVLYGGTFDRPQPFAEMWVWDGASWSLWRAAEGA